MGTITNEKEHDWTDKSLETLTLFVGKQSHFVAAHTLYTTHNTVVHRRRNTLERRSAIDDDDEMQLNFLKNALGSLTETKYEQRTRLEVC